MRRLLILLPLLVGACTDGYDDDTDDTTTELDAVVPTGEVGNAESVCTEAQSTIGVADPPSDLAGVATGAANVARLAAEAAAALAGGDLAPIGTALGSVASANETLAAAASGGDLAELTDAVATATAAYDGLDEAAADAGAPACGSDSWGRHVTIAAADLGAVGG